MNTRSALLALAAILTFLSADAQNNKSVLGTLTCTAVEGELNRFAERAVVLSCLFRDSGGGYVETYAGTLRRFAGAQPINKSIVLIWTVLGAAATLAPGILEQSYTGSGTGSSDPENSHLRGRKDASIVLRPLVQSGQTAENTVTVLDLDLELTRAELAPEKRKIGSHCSMTPR